MDPQVLSPHPPLNGQAGRLHAVCVERQSGDQSGRGKGEITLFFAKVEAEAEGEATTEIETCSAVSLG